MYRRRQSCPSLLPLRPPSKDNTCDKNGDIDSLDLTRPLGDSRFTVPPCPGYKDVTGLTLPKIPKVYGGRSSRENNIKVEIIDLENLKTETNFETRQFSLMESNTRMKGEQATIAESVNLLRIKDDNRGRDFDEDYFKKDKPMMTTYGTKGSLNNNLRDPLTSFQNAPVDLKYQTNKCNPRVQTPTPPCRDRAKISLPSTRNCDKGSEPVHEVPSITVFPDEADTRTNKVTQHTLSLDPRFLMPTEVSQIILRLK